MANYPNDQGNYKGAAPVYTVGGASAVNYATNANTVVKNGPGALEGVTVNTVGTTSTLKLYDGLDNTGTLLATIATTAQVSLRFGIKLAVGLYVERAGGAPANLTIMYF